MALAITAALASLSAPVAAQEQAPAADRPAGSAPVSLASQWRVALHYGADAPLEQLRAFDVVVVEPSHGQDPLAYIKDSAGHSQLYAYVSVGEVRDSTPGDSPIPASMLVGTNRVWHSKVIDTAHPDWPSALLDRLIAPLWARGFRGFFLDTLDAWQTLPGDDSIREQRRQGLIRAIRLIKQRYPGAQLIANRGFEILDEVAPMLEAVAAESMYGRWNQTSGRYERVPDQDRQWLLARFAHVRSLGLRTLAIDYAPETDRAGQREIAERILAHGITPYVSNGALNTIGTGVVQLQPRTVLLVHDRPAGVQDQQLVAHRLVTMPLQYLGYQVQRLDMTAHPALPASLRDRYAGIVAVFQESLPAQAAQSWLELLGRARADGLPIAVLNDLGTPAGRGIAEILDLKRPARPVGSPLALAAGASSLKGFETEVLPARPPTTITAGEGAQTGIRMRDRLGQFIDTVAWTDWGGFALAPHAWRAYDMGENWVIDPIAFLARALSAGGLPFAPDVTTENGRRLLLVHVDGDGFASRAELPGAPFAAGVMLDEFINRYRVPHTVSVIEGEIGPSGLYPELSPALEGIARSIFALDHVEIATHSYSHPFFWRAAAHISANGNEPPAPGMTTDAYDRKAPHLPIPGYRFSLAREITGSADYINRRLAPEGKRVRMMLWTGDCNPPAEAVALADQAGLLNMNGGDTTITQRAPSLGRVAPISIRRGGRLQVLAPNQNENVYTNDWTGPFYGYERVIETFELTERPRRLKPINVYFHTYSATRPASIAALHRVYRYALAQPTFPVFGSDYAAKVRDFESMTVGRVLAADGEPPDAITWEIRGNGQLRTLRIANDLLARIDWQASPGIAGYWRGSDGTYLHLGGSQARLRLLSKANQAQAPPLLAWSDARIDSLQRDPRSLQFRLKAGNKAHIALRHQAHCQVAIGGKAILARRQATDDGPSQVPIYTYGIPRDAARSGTLVSVHC
ncbi:MAG: endo alpha-1,4 polygalactosaminidase [Burkholderiaceae bacterium]